jgi:hypothetical protein
MLYNARRINFEPVVNIPTFRLIDLEQERPLLNNRGQFFVHASEKVPYVRELVRRAQDLNLTVSGDGTAIEKGGDITCVPKGGLITFGTSSRFDMNWVKRDGYFTDNGYQPVYDIVKDWDKIGSALNRFAAAKEDKRRYQDSLNTRYHRSFCVCNGVVHSYEKDVVAVQIPVMPTPRYENIRAIEIRILTY